MACVRGGAPPATGFQHVRHTVCVQPSPPTGGPLTDGTASAARFNYPQSVAVDGSGNVYVADSGNSTIRKITAGGVVTTLAGTAGKSSRCERFGQRRAVLCITGGVAVDGRGNAYVAETDNSPIRKITSGGVGTTLAGTPGHTGSTAGTGHAALFNTPGGVAVDGGLGNV